MLWRAEKERHAYATNLEYLRIELRRLASLAESDEGAEGLLGGLRSIADGAVGVSLGRYYRVMDDDVRHAAAIALAADPRSEQVATVGGPEASCPLVPDAYRWCF